MAEYRLAPIGADDTHDLRLRVLRDGTPSSDVEWVGDGLDTTVHLGVIDASSTIVAISTWLTMPSPDVTAAGAAGVQLRGMATDPSPATRGVGVGALLLRAGIEAARERGADHVWANARTTVLGFYTRAGFEIVSDEFRNEATDLPHHRILLHLHAWPHSTLELRP
ncbi:MAG: GNAT family N-acetyltransferase [Actinomycetota bacterium]|nr:GNAT family N-acetyltransferase [Actinomycetota bacterium]